MIAYKIVWRRNKRNRKAPCQILKTFHVDFKSKLKYYSRAVLAFQFTHSQLKFVYMYVGSIHLKITGLDILLGGLDQALAI